MQILQITNFLPSDAAPKQRVWHIINEVYTRPVCPITGEYVKWFDKDYFKTSSRTAKQLLKWKNGDYDNMNNPAAREARRQGNLRAVQNGRKYRSKDTYTEEQKEKTKQTFFNKYGVDNPSKVELIKKIIGKKSREYQLSNGATPLHLRDKRKLYNYMVSKFTKAHLQENADKICVNNNINDPTVDHIFSKSTGFKNNIPPYIIGHWTNLQVIDRKENSAKRDRCDKTEQQLFDDFFKNL